MGAYVVEVTLANAFLIFPLIVAAAEAIWGPNYSSLELKAFVYLSTFSLVPLAGLAGHWARRLCASRDGPTRLLDLALVAPGIISALLYLGPAGSWSSLGRIELIAGAASVCLVIGVALTFILPWTWAQKCDRACQPIAAVVWFVSPLVYAAVVLWGEAGWLLGRLEDDGAFRLGLLAGALSVASLHFGPRLCRSQSGAARLGGWSLLAALAAVAVALIFAIAFHAPYYTPGVCDTVGLPLTYGEWVGPAVAALAGGVPMVDAHSQYGFLDYLVYAVPFALGLPRSYWAAFAVTGFFNLAALALVMALCLKAARNRFLAVVAIAVVAPALPLIWYLIPANSAVRFFPPLLLLPALAGLRPGRTWSWATIASIVLCSLWSLETLAWILGGYIAFLAATYLEERGGLSQRLRSLALALAAAACAHVVLNLAVYGLSGSWPRYDIYLGFFPGQVTGHGAAIPELGNHKWPLLLAACVAALSYALSTVLWRDQASPRARRIATTLILPGAALTALELSYWVSRPYAVLLWDEVLPVFVATVLVIDGLLARHRSGGWRLRALAAPAHVTLAAAVVILAGCAGFTAALRLNPGAAAAYGRAVVTGEPIASCIGQRVVDAVALVEKYSPDRPDALFFMPAAEDVSVALYSHHRQRLGYTIIVGDTISHPLMREAERRLSERVKAGDVFVTMAYSLQPKSGFSIDNAVMGGFFLSELAERFQGCEIERTPRDVVAVRLMPKGENSCKGVGKPFVHETRYVP